MKALKIGALIGATYLLTMGQAYASISVPEIDGSGAIIGVGLVIGLVALVREKFYRS